MSHRPANTLLHRVRAPALVATPARDSEPPVGSAWLTPPARFAQSLGDEVPRDIGATAIGVGHCGTDPGSPGERHQSHRNGPGDQVRRRLDVGQRGMEERIRDGGDVGNGLDLDVQHRNGDGDNRQCSPNTVITRPTTVGAIPE